MLSFACRAFVLATVIGGAVPALADEPMYLCHEPPPQTKITVTFKPSVSLHDLVAWAGGFTCKNIVFSADAERAAQNMTIVAPKPLTPKQAQQLFVDSLETIGLVVTVKADTITIKLGPKAVAHCSSVASTDHALPALRDPTPSDAEDPAVDVTAVIAKGIGQVDETHYTITAELVDVLLANPMSMAKGARVVPAVKNGKPSGFKLYAIRPNSLFAKLGLQNGDSLEKINGIELTSADKALDVYTSLRDAKKLEVLIERRGAKKTLYYTIQR